MHPDLYLFVEGVRARELWEEADRQRKARLVAPASVISAFEERLGWVLVRTGRKIPAGVRLVRHQTRQGNRRRVTPRPTAAAAPPDSEAPGRCSPGPGTSSKTSLVG